MIRSCNRYSCIMGFLLIAVLAMWSGILFALHPEADDGSAAWCGVNDPEDIGLQTIRVDAEQGQAGIRAALDALKCRGTLEIGPGIYPGKDKPVNESGQVVNTNKGDLPCNLKIRGDGNPLMDGWIFWGNLKNHGCVRLEGFTEGPKEVDAGRNPSWGKPTYYSEHQVRRQNRGRLIMDNHPVQTLTRKGLKVDPDDPRRMFVEIVDSDFPACTSGGKGRHHCFYLEMPNSYIFVQGSTIGPADWTAFRGLGNVWMRNSTVTGPDEPMADVLKGSNLVEQLGCANSLYERNVFDTGVYLTGAHPVNVIGRRSYGGCLDIDYPAPLSTGFYRPGLHVHVFRDNHFINRNAESFRSDGSLKPGYSAIELESSDHEMALNGFGRSTWAWIPPDYTDPAAVYLDPSNQFVGWGDNRITIREGVIGAQPTPADLMRCDKGVEPVIEEIMDGDKAIGYRLLGIKVDGHDVPDMQEAFDATCDPWDYASYPIDRRAGRSVPGPVLVEKDTSKMTARDIFGDHPLMARWRELAGDNNQCQ